MRRGKEEKRGGEKIDFKGHRNKPFPRAPRYLALVVNYISQYFL